MATHSEWCGVYIGSARSMEAVKSWFAPYLDDLKILSARVLSDIRTDATKKVEVIVSDKDGGKRVVTRTFGKKTFSIRFRPYTGDTLTRA